MGFLFFFAFHLHEDYLALYKTEPFPSVFTKSNTSGNGKLPISTMYLVLVSNRERRGPVSLRLVEPQVSVALGLKNKRTTKGPTVATKPPGQATYQDSKREVLQKGAVFLISFGCCAAVSGMTA